MLNNWFLTITTTLSHDTYTVTTVMGDTDREARISAQDYFEQKYGILGSDCERVIMGNNCYWYRDSSFSAALMQDVRK